MVKGVVKGIGDYGKAFGIPIVGGEVAFDDSYNTIHLSMLAGTIDINNMISATAKGPGNRSLYWFFQEKMGLLERHLPMTIRFSI